MLKTFSLSENNLDVEYKALQITSTTFFLNLIKKFVVDTQLSP